MDKLVAVFLGTGEASKANVYPKNVMDALHEIVEIDEHFILREEFDAYKEVLQKATYVFSTWGMLHLTQEEIKQYLPNVKSVFYAAGSVQHFAKEFLELNIPVYSAWKANAIPVAEYTLAQILLAGKGTFSMFRIMGRDNHKKRMDLSNTYPCNYMTNVGILGAGAIGRKVLEYLQPFKFNLYVFDPFASDELLEKYNAKRATLEWIFENCETISNHIANLPQTVGMLQYAHFSKMKPTATFINTARGAQVVEDDMIKALQEVPTRCAYLDVTWPEPPVETSPLYTMDNVFLTPHIAGSKNKECGRMGEYMVDALKDVLENKENENIVTLKMLETMA